MKYLLLSSNSLSGIGQVMIRYRTLLELQGHSVDMRYYGDAVTRDTYDVGFAFLLPFVSVLDAADKHMEGCARKLRMTVCETEPVHEAYGLFARYPEVLVPSEFSKRILEKQFPNITFKKLLHYAPIPTKTVVNMGSFYTFYTIGNIADFRKNIPMLLRAMERFPNARLVLKATCKQPIKIPGNQILVLNQFMNDDEMDRLHDSCHCYVNCSHSEGVGMGAVEAAIRNKPVILTDYGGCKEYVKTPWIVSCTPVKVGRDEFLFKKDTMWGLPSFSELITHMQTCYNNNIRHYSHEHTHILMNTLKNKVLD